MFALRYAARNLRRNLRRTIVTLLGVASLLFLTSFLLSIVGGLGMTTETDGSELRLITRHQVSLTNPLPEPHWQKIRALPHVAEACASSWYGGKYIDERNFFARFFVEPDCHLVVMPELVIPPDQVEAWKGDQRGALVSAKLAEKYQWELGEQIHMDGDIYPVDVDLVLRAIFTGGEDALYFHRDYMEEALGRPGIVGTYTILVDAPENLAAVSAAVDAAFEDSDAPTKTETEKAFQASFAEMFGNVKGLVTNLALVIALTVLLTAGNTMAMAIRERGRELALLKALGFTGRRIVSLVVAESLLLVGAAAVLGIGGFWLPSWILFRVMELRLPMVWFPLTLTPLHGALLFGGALLVGLLTGLVPALVVASRSTLSGLRRA